MRIAPFLGFILIAVTTLVSCSADNGTFSLTNQSTDSIAHAQITICGQTIEFKGLPPSASATGSYKVTSDSHFVVRVEFASGKILAGKGGYVSHGADFRHEIVVTDEDIKVTMISAK